MTLFLSNSHNCISIAAISFVILLLIYKTYILIRSKFKILVNCWFCNENLKVPYGLRNSWDCPNCDQYNGFTDDGDYNREIEAQLTCCNTSSTVSYAQRNNSPGKISHNGLCDTCNENQRIIVEKLAQFEPKNEKGFEKEFQKYKTNLEQKHRLCVSCERIVSKVLREKKKMVLGSKLATLIFNNVRYLKTSPLVRHVQRSRKTYLRNFCSLSLFGLAVINVAAMINELMKNEIQYSKSEDLFSRIMNMIILHVLTLGKVFTGYLQYIWKYGLIEKIYLYTKTLAILSYYSLGFRFDKTAIVNPLMPLINLENVPFGSILFAIVSNILDGFKLGKSTLLLIMWCIHAGIINNTLMNDYYGIELLKVLSSIIVLGLSFPSFKRSNEKLLNSTTNSFHRIYSEDYLNDDISSAAENSSILERTLMNNSNSKNITLNSSGNSIKSFTGKDLSPRFLSPTKLNREMSSSLFNLQTTNTNLNNLHSPVGNNSLFTKNINCNLQKPFEKASSCNNGGSGGGGGGGGSSDWSRPMSTLNFSTSFLACNPENKDTNFEYQFQKVNSHHHPVSSIMNENSRIHHNFSKPNSNGNNSICRRNLLSPSRLNTSNHITQVSWVSGGYFNVPNKMPTKNYFLESVGTKENVSRASSQSSGFESHGSSQSLQNGEIIFSRENSCSLDDGTLLFSQNDLLNADQYKNSIKPADNSIGLLPQFTSKSLCNNLIQTNSQSPCPSINTNFTCQSQPYFGGSQEYLINPIRRTARNTFSPFDLNKMSEDLPPIQKGSLLRKWNEQQSVNI